MMESIRSASVITLYKLCLHFVFQIDFESMTVRSVAEARLLEEREQRQRILNEEKLKKIESHLNGNQLKHAFTIAHTPIYHRVYIMYMYVFVSNCCVELEPELLMAAQTLETCLELLIPTPEEFFIPEAEQRSAAPLSLAEPSLFKSPVDDLEDKNASHRETGAIDSAAVVSVTLKPGDYYIF